jgi:hypothetical protein
LTRTAEWIDTGRNDDARAGNVLWIVKFEPVNSCDIDSNNVQPVMMFTFAQWSHTLANSQAPEGREFRRTGGMERVGLVGDTGMIRPGIDLTDHSEPRALKNRE